jgi:cytidylate kinase
VHHTMETILRLAELGNTVIYGRGSNIITGRLKHVVNVRLVGSMERRIPQAAEQYEVSLKEAKQLILKEDRGRKRYIKLHFGKDIDDPLLYDIVLNTDKLTDQAIVKIIADLALNQSESYLNTKPSQKQAISD